MLTERDRKYLRALYLLDSQNEPVGPTALGSKMDVSRVGALKKMRRLEALGLGDYIHKKGFRLNECGVEVVEKDVRNHHVLEKYFQEKLGFSSSEACQESASMGDMVSDRFVNHISDQIDEEVACECGCKIRPPYDHEDLKECHWMKEQFKVEEER